MSDKQLFVSIIYFFIASVGIVMIGAGCTVYQILVGLAYYNTCMYTLITAGFTAALGGVIVWNVRKEECNVGVN